MTANISRAELEAAPHRESWQKPTTYESLYLLPTRKKHDSGYHVICIVGATAKDGKEMLEQAAWCDDICWQVNVDKYGMRSDMTYPGGVVHVWGARFTVGASLSSTDVTVESASSVSPSPAKESEKV